MRLPGSVLQGILARGALVLLRIFLGLVFLYSGWLKLGAEPPWPADRVSLAAALAGAELLVGALLVSGLLTRLAAALAVVLMVNYMLPTEPEFLLTTSSQLAFAVIAVALLIGAAGRTLGLDSILARRWPRSPLW